MVGEGNETFLIWVWKPLLNRCVLKIVRLTTVHDEQKRTISSSDRLGLLQMVSEPDIGRCALEDVWAPKGVDCEIPRWLEKGTKPFLLECENLSLTNAF